MFKKYILLLVWIFSIDVFAVNNPNFSSFFNKKDGCFILYDLAKNKTIVRYNSKQCAKRISPCSTFKIPLSIMAFDQGVFKSVNEIIKWDDKDHGLPEWNKDQTPKTWLQYSTVWVSQLITPQLGANKIAYYLKDFQYGNQDVSGGITNFWLGSTLKISADEQLRFLKHMWENKLLASKYAINTTRNAFYAEQENNNVIQSKTGSGLINDLNGDYKIGWFVGYLSSNNCNYIFITNFTSGSEFSNFPGQEAKEITKHILQELNLW